VHQNVGFDALTNRSDQVVARLLAAAADLGANTAVLVVGGMPFALSTTRFARRCAGLDHCPQDAQIRRGLTYCNPGGRLAGVGAVEAEANAAHHFLHVVLHEIGVGATRAAGGAVEALFDTAQKGVVIDTCRLWM
jgi:threonine dehydrogenase-like Zn-dependent dehydrogenase